eukprot:PhF_6_TR10208/c0_g3_i3/m.15824
MNIQQTKSVDPLRWTSSQSFFADITNESQSFVSLLALRSLRFDPVRPLTPIPKRTTRCAAVMFVDISGYSKAAVTLNAFGPHALADAVNAYYTELLDVVHEYNGDVVKFAGDAIIVVWSEAMNDRLVCGLAAMCAYEL